MADVSQFDDVPCTDDTFSGKVLYQILINASIVFTLNFFLHVFGGGCIQIIILELLECNFCILSRS